MNNITERGVEIDDTSIVFLNCQSLRSNFHHISAEIKQLDKKPICICLQEIWKPENCHKYITGYSKLESYERTGNSNVGGGVGIFVREDLDYQLLKKNFIPKVWVINDTAVVIQEFTIF